MWLLSFLPSWFFQAVFAAGIAGFTASYMLKMIPFFSANATAVRVGSVLAIAISIWFFGASYNEAKWQERVKALEAKLAVAEEQSKQANTKIDNKVASKTVVIKQRGKDIVRYVEVEVSKYDATCKIPKEFINAHNRAAEQPK